MAYVPTCTMHQVLYYPELPSAKLHNISIHGTTSATHSPLLLALSCPGSIFVDFLGLVGESRGGSGFFGPRCTGMSGGETTFFCSGKRKLVGSNKVVFLLDSMHMLVQRKCWIWFCDNGLVGGFAVAGEIGVRRGRKTN